VLPAEATHAPLGAVKDLRKGGAEAVPAGAAETKSSNAALGEAGGRLPEGAAEKDAHPSRDDDARFGGDGAGGGALEKVCQLSAPPLAAAGGAGAAEKLAQASGVPAA